MAFIRFHILNSKQNLLSGFLYTYFVFSVTVRRMEIEDKCYVCSVEYNHLISLVLSTDVSL